MLHKPWLPTEITLMRTDNSNIETLRASKHDSITTYYYIVKNAPYTLKGRYEMVEGFLQKKLNLYSKQGVHIKKFVFSKEGWSFYNGFPYFKYIDRTYRDNPLTYRDIEDDDVSNRDAFIPYGGASGFMGNEIATYSIHISSKNCQMYAHLKINRSFLHIKTVVENIEYTDSSFGNTFSFRTGDYTPDIPECEGVVNEGDKVIKGLRL